MEILVGNTGFVGSNLAAIHTFDAGFHSTDIAQAFSLKPDLCVYAGVRAEKYLAAKDPQADLDSIRIAIDNVERIAPKRLVLISTIDVYPEPILVNETNEIRSGTHPYGANRLYLEQWVQSHIKEHLIVRLPALFGTGLKKNFLFDLIRIVPSMLNAEKFSELSNRSQLIRNAYSLQSNGFYKLGTPASGVNTLRAEFETIGFSALHFTDSRSTFQFYNLAHLWEHLQSAIEQNISLMNIATAPISAAEIYLRTKGNEFHNELNAKPLHYDARTIYADRLGGRNGYLMDKSSVLDEIDTFVRAEQARLA